MRFFIITALIFLIYGATSSFADEKDEYYDKSSSPYSSSNDSSSTSNNDTSSCDDIFNKGSLVSSPATDKEDENPRITITIERNSYDPNMSRRGYNTYKDSSSATGKKVVKKVRNTQGSVRLYNDGTLSATSFSDNEPIKSMFSYISWLSSKLHDIKDIARIPGVFMALRKNGSVIIWGDALDPDLNRVGRLYDIDSISSKKYAFYAKKIANPQFESVMVDFFSLREMLMKRKNKAKPTIIIVEREPDTTSEFYQGFTTKEVKVFEEPLIIEKIFGIPINLHQNIIAQSIVRICSDPSKLKIEEKE